MFDFIHPGGRSREKFLSPKLIDSREWRA